MGLWDCVEAAACVAAESIGQREVAVLTRGRSVGRSVGRPIHRLPSCLPQSLSHARNMTHMYGGNLCH